MRTLIEALEQRVLLTDGAAARRLRDEDLDVGRDFFGAEGLLAVLNLTRPELVRRTHEAYLKAGADVIRTNSLGASPLSLAGQGFAGEAFFLNHAAAEIATQAVDSLPGRGRRRFVLGVVRDEGWDVAPAEIESAVAVQVEGLLSGGVDGITLDVLPGAGRTPVFLRGARRAVASLDARAPIFLQRGPAGADFSDLAKQRAEGVIRYRHGPAARAGLLAAAIEDSEVNLVGGGDLPEDTARLDAQLRGLAEDGFRPYLPANRPSSPDQIETPSSVRAAALDPALAG